MSNNSVVSKNKRKIELKNSVVEKQTDKVIKDKNLKKEKIANVKNTTDTNKENVKSSNESGPVSLLELMMVLTIGLSLFIGALIQAGDMIERRNIHREALAIYKMKININNAYSFSSSYDDLTVDLMDDLLDLEPSYKIEDNKVKTNFGEIDLSTAYNNEMFVISYSMLDTKMCIEILNKIKSVDFNGVQVTTPTSGYHSDFMIPMQDIENEQIYSMCEQSNDSDLTMHLYSK